MDWSGAGNVGYVVRIEHVPDEISFCVFGIATTGTDSRHPVDSMLAHALISCSLSLLLNARDASSLARQQTAAWWWQYPCYSLKSL